MPIVSPNTGREAETEGLEVKVVFSYISSLKPAWSVLKKRNHNMIYVTRVLGANSTNQFGIGCYSQVWRRRRSSEIAFLMQFLELAGTNVSDDLLRPQFVSICQAQNLQIFATSVSLPAGGTCC